MQILKILHRMDNHREVAHEVSVNKLLDVSKLGRDACDACACKQPVMHAQAAKHLVDAACQL